MRSTGEDRDENATNHEDFFEKFVPNALRLAPKQDSLVYVFRLFSNEVAEWTIDLGRRKVHRGSVESRSLR
ncbi:MAG: hypothetical protein R3C68_17640 [Myxococcota bacterium]